jgi:hypothetical protein
VGWDVLEASGVFDSERIPFSSGMANLAVFYETNAEGIAVATDVVILDNHLPLTWWTYDSANPLDFVFAENMYTRDDFQVSNLPIILNGEQTNLKALVGLDGVFVPFRRVFLHVGFGNRAHLDNEGLLHFGGGGGSDNSNWAIGVPSVQLMGGFRRPLDLPPIIVDGVIYVSLQAFFTGASPFAGAWVFEDRIEIWGEVFYPFGPSVGGSTLEEGRLSSEDVSAMPILVNGVQIDATAELVDSWRIAMPFAEIGSALDLQLDYANVEQAPTTIHLRWLAGEIWYNFRQDVAIAGIVHEGKIQIVTWDRMISGLLP